MVDSVTPVPGVNSQVTTGGQAVIAVDGGVNGGFITNPASPTDQGLVTPEILYVDPVVEAGLVANGTTFALYPGQTWTLIPGQTTPTRVNASSGGHKFSVVSW